MESNQRRTILLCEENQLLADVLKDEYDLLTGKDGNEAWDILKQHSERIFVILTDLGMPDSSRYELIEKVNNTEHLSDIPVIVIAGEKDSVQEQECLKLGVYDYVTKPIRPFVLRNKLTNLLKIQETIFSLQNIEKDELTGLYTRRAFLYHAKHLLDENKNIFYDILIADIENFKHINFDYGEKVGDELLVSAAKFIQKEYSDAVCGRYGSDIFIGIYPSSEQGRMKRVDGMMQRFREYAPIPNLVIKCGIYQNVDRSLSIVNMCDRALMALKSIKHDNTQNIALFKGLMCQNMLRDQRYETMFQDALEKKEFVIYYQPQYDPYQNKIVGLEALVRWKRNGELISPGEFLPVFEANKSIIQLDEYVFQSVCTYQRKRKELGKELLPISINISRQTMLQKKLVKRFREIMKENDVEPLHVPIEITESAVVNSKDVKSMVTAFSSTGFSVRMDDFGSGCSSLSDLNVLPFDMIKLDKSLIDHIGDKRGEVLLRHTISLIKELGMHLIAEGVETQEQVAFLMQQECEIIQGFYYYKPLSEEELELVL